MYLYNVQCNHVRPMRRREQYEKIRSRYYKNA